MDRATEDRATEDGAAVGWGRLRKNPQNTRNCGLAMGADFRLSTPARTRTILKMPEENPMFFQLSPRRSPR
jgi:hypothetical protein